MYLTPAEVTALITAGWTVQSGPHATEGECLDWCGAPDDPGDIVRTVLGEASADSGDSVDTLSIAGVTVDEDELLIVAITSITNGLGLEGWSVEFDGTPMTLLESEYASQFGLAVYGLLVGANTTGDIVWADSNGNVHSIAMNAEAVSGLTSATPAQTATDSGTGTNPSVSLGTPVPAGRYVFAAVGTYGPSTDDDGSYGGGLVDSGQDVGSGTGTTDDCRLCTGGLPTESEFTADVEKTGITSRSWKIIGIEFN